MDSNDISCDWKVSWNFKKPRGSLQHFATNPRQLQCGPGWLSHHRPCKEPQAALPPRDIRKQHRKRQANKPRRGGMVWKCWREVIFSILREMFEVVAYCALIGLILIIYAPTFQQCVCCSFSRRTFYCQVLSRGLSPTTSKFVLEVQTRKGSGLRALENIGNHTGWCPPVISWFIIPINYYSYICHKP